MSESSEKWKAERAEKLRVALLEFEQWPILPHDTQVVQTTGIGRWRSRPQRPLTLAMMGGANTVYRIRPDGAIVYWSPGLGGGLAPPAELGGVRIATP